MRDKIGRNIDYIRISVTDRCNLRCIYCMPEEGVESIPHSKILSFDDIIRVCTVLAKDGLKKIKLTGGEPLVRKGIVNLVRELKGIDGIESVTITTNGVLLEEYYDALVQAGIDAITVSLDTLNPVIYEEITRRNQLEKVLKGLKMAIAKGGTHIKINCVPVLGIEKQDVMSLVEIARDNDVHIRFIEMMPIGLGTQYKFITEDELKGLLTAKYGELQPYSGVLGNGPSEYYTVEGFKGKIGFISAVSHKFCDRCNRVRLTADGFLKTCLQYDYGTMLKPMLDEGCTDGELVKVIEEAIEKKPKGHSFDKIDEFNGQEHRKMSQIGG
ncbi:MAG: GTP 3',8-cyclase MoaA [Oscillospiraceae bacterium]